MNKSTQSKEATKTLKINMQIWIDSPLSIDREDIMNELRQRIGKPYSIKELEITGIYG